MPTLVMFREPLEQVASFFNFARKGRTAISGAATWPSFIRSPILMRPHRDTLTYWYPSPVHYWVQFYHATLSWSAPVAFIEMRALQKNPSLIFKALGGLGVNVVYQEPVNLPAGYLSRNDDRHISARLAFESDTSLDRERVSVQAVIEGSTPEDKALIDTEDVRNTFQKLIAKSLMNL